MQVGTVRVQRGWRETLRALAMPLDLLWLGIILIIAINEINAKPFIGFVAWLFLIWIPFSIKGSRTCRWYERNIEKTQIRSWFFESGLPLILMSLGLLFLGPSQSGEGYVTLTSPFGTRVEQTSALTIRTYIPIYERYDYWPIQNKVQLDATAITSDGKKITANISVELSMEDSPQASLQLVKSFGSREAYWNSLEKGVIQEFAVEVSKIPLEKLSNTLLLEDHVGTSLGLQGLKSRWSGKIIITEIHRFADTK